MKKIHSEFDKEFKIVNTIFWVMFTLIVSMFIAILSFQGYMAWRYGPKVLNLIDKGAGTVEKALDKADKLLSE